MQDPDSLADVRPLSFRISRELAAELETAARARGESVSSFVRRAVEERLHPDAGPPAISGNAGAFSGATMTVQFSPNVVVTGWTVSAPTEVSSGRPRIG
jgi:hypothetical protein